MLIDTSLILAIETSCDETSVAVMRSGDLLSNVVYSQVDLHKKFGGVVPDIARLEHSKKLPVVLMDALTQAGVSLENITLVAVTVGPGLAVALEVGIAHAKEVVKQIGVTLVAVNHMEGHLLSWSTLDRTSASYPSLGLLVSGKHSEIIKVNGVGGYEKIGQTLDDACGEAYDKCARMLGLEYPGGAALSKLAQHARTGTQVKVERDHQSSYVSIIGSDPEFRLPIPLYNQPELDFSYSGLKTAVRRLIEKHPTLEKEKVALLFEEAALLALLRKLEQALDMNPEIKEVWMGGGVVANTRLQELVSSLAQERSIVLRYPKENSLLGDNAGMIANVVWERGEAGKLEEIIVSSKDLDSLERQPRLSF